MFTKLFLTLFIVLSSSWLALAVWVQQPINQVCTYILLGFIIMNVIATLYFVWREHQKLFKHITSILYMFAVGVIWFFNLSPSNDKNWNKEVAHNVDFQQNGDLITVYNVRNFDWKTEQDYDEYWETRHYDLNQLENVDLVLSTWGIDEIAHTLVSFNFANGQRLAFSIEIRKEQHEQFSSLDGFFRKYELAFIASDEQDVIFTRSNMRTDESTYIYPLKLSKTVVRQLFLSYLQRGKQLQTQAQWYNSLTANCTTLIYDMVKEIEPVPFDYRIIASGLLAEYLYQHQVLDNRYTLDEWKKRAYIQPKTKDFQAIHGQTHAQFSEKIRQGLP